MGSARSARGRRRPSTPWRIRLRPRVRRTVRQRPRPAAAVPSLEPLADELDFVLQVDAEALLHSVPRFFHQSVHVGSPRLAEIFDEVAVLLRDPCLSDPMPAEPALVDEFPGFVTRWILERAA